MKKLIVLLMALVIFFVPFGSAFAYTGGLLHGKAVNRGSDASNIQDSPNSATDGNETAGAFLGANGSATDTLWYEFSQPVDLNAYQIKASGNVQLKAVKSDGTIINVSDFPNVGGVKTTMGTTYVKKVYLQNITSGIVTVFEFDVFGTVATPSASKGDWKLGGNYTSGTVQTGLTDNNTSTYSEISPWGQSTDTLWADLTNAKVNSITVKHASYSNTSNLKVRLLDSNTQIIFEGSLSSNATSTTFNPVYKGSATKILIANTSSSEWYRVTDISLVLSYEGEKTYDELSNLTLSATHDAINLNWDNPSSNADFTGTKIYKNGTFLKSVDSSTKTFTDSNVSAETNYTYKVTAVYSDGHETAGISKSVTTKPPPPPDRDGDGIPDDEDEYPDDPTNTPPPVEAGEVKNLEITTTYKSANLSWVLPKSENLQHVNIYRETLTQETSFMDKLINGKTVYAAGEKIFETNGTYFNDYTVEPGTEYEYKVTTTSVDGVESEGVTGRTKTPGKPLIDFEEVSLPFSVKDLLLSGNGLLWIIGPFILLALAFLLVPKLRNLILGAFRKDSKGSSEAAERRTKAEAIQKMERQEAKEFRTAREPKSERVEVAPKPTKEPKEIKQPRIREPKERIRTAKLTRERIREPRAPRAPRERTRKPRDRRGIS